MKKFKIQSFFQKNFLRKNILNKLFSKFFFLFNLPKSTLKIGFNQFKKKNIENGWTQTRLPPVTMWIGCYELCKVVWVVCGARHIKRERWGTNKPKGIIM